MEKVNSVSTVENSQPALGVKGIAVTQEQLIAWRGGACIPVVMPGISQVDREFIMMGITAEEWQVVFGTTGAAEG
jgi:hypothetical protein